MYFLIMCGSPGLGRILKQMHRTVYALIYAAGGLLLANLFPAATIAQIASRPSPNEQIAQAVQALPLDLRAGATVLVFDPKTAARRVLRQGTNSLDCEPTDPADGFSRCYSKLVAPRRELEVKLRSQGKSGREIQQAIAQAIQAGTLKLPPFGTMSYRLSKRKGVIQRLWIMSVPYATTDSIGVSTVSQRDAALQGHPLPWLMLPGTADAHLMIPTCK